jgi:hypothetical protein
LKDDCKNDSQQVNSIKKFTYVTYHKQSFTARSSLGHGRLNILGPNLRAKGQCYKQIYGLKLCCYELQWPPCACVRAVHNLPKLTYLATIVSYDRKWLIRSALSYYCNILYSTDPCWFRKENFWFFKQTPFFVKLNRPSKNHWGPFPGRGLGCFVVG